jgi:hypothetical protein
MLGVFGTVESRACQAMPQWKSRQEWRYLFPISYYLVLSRMRADLMTNQSQDLTAAGLGSDDDSDRSANRHTHANTLLVVNA